MVQCKSCGEPVVWSQTDAGKVRCFNPDGTIHWDHCSQVRNAKIIATGTHFKTDDTEGYYTHLKRSGVHLTMKSVKSRYPAPKLKPGCGHCVAPWEDCPRGCPNAFA